MVALLRSHHYGTDYNKELAMMRGRVHSSWVTVAEKLYRGYCRTIREEPRKEGQTYRPQMMGIDDASQA